MIDFQNCVYYPGSGSDGHPVKFFGSLHMASSFIYVDYGLSRESIERDLDNPEKGYNGHFKGYHSHSRITLKIEDIIPDGWESQIEKHHPNKSKHDFANIQPYAFLELLQRDSHLDEKHGPKQLNIMFLGADGHATYDALFCQGISPNPPLAIVLQDHGFGGNYSKFGRGGLLESIAKNTQVYPRYLLVAEGTDPWDGYERAIDYEGTRGGGNGRIRHLYERKTAKLISPMNADHPEHNS